MSRLNFLFAAYTVIWILLFLYVQILSRRNRRLERELDELRAVLEHEHHKGTGT